MNSVEKFAAEATLFERWLLDGTDQGADAARECLVRLLELYRAALDLPPEWSDALEDAVEVERLDEAQWEKAYGASRRLPVDHYNEVFNPTVEVQEDPVTGSIADDLADIYRDVATGLRAYEKGNLAGAVWEWSFHLHIHWGAHATSAIRVMHWWLTENAIDRLSLKRPAG